MSFHMHEKPIRYLNPEEIKTLQPFSGIGPEDMGGALERAKQRMQVAGVWESNQVLGKGYPIGCVALEITQRCNLDCTLCYLSEMSESTKDIPMEEIYRRIDMIKNHYGPGTDVQITGGDPTLRKRSELMEIIRRVRDMNMRPTLMTNGIAATRDLIQEMAQNGLHDIAIHVDLTQERKGDYKTEADLHKFRLEYIERCRNLPIHVIFNTTVFKDNYNEIPDLIRFFRKHSDVVGMASFQMQADTGRGLLKKREDQISMDGVIERIQQGADTKISFDNLLIGHPRCHRYGLTMQVNGKSFNFFDDKEFISMLLEKTSKLKVDRNRVFKSIVKIVKWAFTTEGVFWPGLKFISRKIWQMKTDFVLGGFRVNKLSFFVQNFMDASSLEADRVHACSFMVMTPQGPISMCLHNAKRDDYILQKLPVKVGGVEKNWDPLTGKADAEIIHS